MDVSLVAAVGSFVVSERVLKPKATALFMLLCVLAYDLTTKTHDPVSLRVYRGTCGCGVMVCSWGQYKSWDALPIVDRRPISSSNLSFCVHVMHWRLQPAISAQTRTGIAGLHAHDDRTIAEDMAEERRGLRRAHILAGHPARTK